MLHQGYTGLAASLLIGGLITLAQAQSTLLTNNTVPTRNPVRPVTENQPKASPAETPATSSEVANSMAPEDTASVNTAASIPKSHLFMWMKMLPLPPVAKLSPIEKAYLDVYAILHEDNQCSRFYGGPIAIEALNELARQLKSASFDRSIALRMTGSISYTMNHSTGLSYRLFEKAELNVNGAFFKSHTSPTDTTISRVGEFSPNTREARIAIILHELGHLIQVSRNHWILPNDGNDPNTSEQNTLKVVETCREQIKGRARVSFEETLAKLHADEQTIATLNASDATPANIIEKPEAVRQNGSQLDARCWSCRREIQIPQDY